MSTLVLSIIQIVFCHIRLAEVYTTVIIEEKRAPLHCNHLPPEGLFRKEKTNWVETAGRFFLPCRNIA